jgi:RNA polymerase sigma-70 factor, ECF subfamily
VTDLNADACTKAALEQNRRWLTGFVLSSCGDRWAAEDIVQEVFKTAVEKQSSFVPGTNYGAWLRAIAVNCVKRHFKATQRRPVLVGDAWDHLERAAARLQDRAIDPSWEENTLGALQDCMSKLTDRVREILRLRFAEDRSSRDVSAALQMTVAAVDVTVFRAREKLADCVKRRVSYARP